MHNLKSFFQAMAVALATTALASPAMADGLSFALYGHGHGNGGNTTPPPSTTCTYVACNLGSTDAFELSSSRTPDTSSYVQKWMSPEVFTAWGDGSGLATNGSYMGQGTTMVFVDDFSSSSTFTPSNWSGTGVGGGFTGNESTTSQQHGWWTSEEGGMIAPYAKLVGDNFSNEDPIYIVPNQFNAVNMSYGMMGKTKLYSSSWDNSYAQEKSIIDGAALGNAFYSKAAGNDSVAIDGTYKGTSDYLNLSLAAEAGGTNFSGIFVGAVDNYGSDPTKLELSFYSNYAGSNTDVQKHFLVVNVDYKTTGLAGTSFAAPIITGYAAILASKFTTASPTQVANQLLSTARTDNLVNYNAATYGVGEASLSRALSPASIN